VRCRQYPGNGGMPTRGPNRSFPQPPRLLPEFGCEPRRGGLLPAAADVGAAPSRSRGASAATACGVGRRRRCLQQASTGGATACGAGTSRATGADVGANAGVGEEAEDAGPAHAGQVGTSQQWAGWSLGSGSKAGTPTAAGFDHGSRGARDEDGRWTSASSIEPRFSASLQRAVCRTNGNANPAIQSRRRRPVASLWCSVPCNVMQRCATSCNVVQRLPHRVIDMLLYDGLFDLNCQRWHKKNAILGERTGGLT